MAAVLDEEAARIERSAESLEERQAIINRAADKMAVLVVLRFPKVDEAATANQLRRELRKRIN